MLTPIAGETMPFVTRNGEWMPRLRNLVDLDWWAMDHAMDQIFDLTAPVVNLAIEDVENAIKN